MYQEYDYELKLVIIGSTAVGKSSLLMRYSDDKFSEDYLTTLGVDFRFKSLLVDNLSIKLQIWDTAGQERFRTITTQYYKGANGIVLCYDTTNQQSFDELQNYWQQQVTENADQKVELLLLGNKSDLLEDKQVKIEEAKSYADQNNLLFSECSAKDNQGVHEAIQSLVNRIILHQQDFLNKEQAHATHLNYNSSPKSQFNKLTKQCC